MASRSGAVDADQDALFRALMTTHGNAVLMHAQGWTHDRGLAEDILQEAFLKVWTHPEVLVNGKGSVRSWLLTVVDNIAKDRHRARDARPKEVPEDPDRPWVQEDPAEAVVESVTLQDALDRLTPQHREVLQHVYIWDRGVPEAARALKQPQRTVRERMARALSALHQVMRSLEGGSREASA